MNPYKVAENLNNKLFKIYNIYSNLSFFFQKLFTNRFKILNKNIFLKQSSNDFCIICGNGPSLNDFDFNSVKGKPIFTVNYFFNGNHKINIEPTYHVVIDNAFTKSDLPNLGLNYIIDSYKSNLNTKFILRFDMLSKIKNFDSLLSRAYFLNYKNIQYKDYLRINMTEVMTASQNVILMCLQIALFMGFKKIFLIGCENNFFSNYSHFYSSENLNFKPSSWEGLNYIDLAFKHYDAIRKYSDKKNVDIINITPQSYINSFKHMTLQEFYSSYSIGSKKFLP